MVKIKICGITNQDDALTAAEAGADALGFIFYQNSPRYITPGDAGRIALSLPPFVTTVGVFVNESPETVNRCMKEAGLSAAQLHGEETPAVCARVCRPVIKAIRAKSERDLYGMKSYRVSAFLLDAKVEGLYGGTGERIPLETALEAGKYGRIILAGGLNPENVAQAVRQVKPYGVDVSSGVETAPGRKDHVKIERFIREARNAIP